MDAPVAFRLLGPLEVRVRDQPVLITAQREAVVMAALLFQADTLVSTDQLVDAVWDGLLPANPANQIAICVLALRRKLAAAGAPGDVIVTRAPGYLVRTDAAELDTRLVERHVERAAAATADGRPEEAPGHLRAALGRWRGPVLSGVRSRRLRPEIVRWEERRLALFEQCVQAELDLGHHHRVIGELSAMVADANLRERPREQLMVALCRAGRSAQALSVYRVTRRLFREELGIEPSEHLRGVHDAILAGTLDPAPEPVGAAGYPTNKSDH
jgi:DNA-binding SARP family transcriptional activator